jgi:hypothetical protein
LKAALQQLVVEHPALLLEEKPASIVIHYRRAPEIGPGVERRLQAILTKADLGLGIFPSKMSWDIRDGTCTKGTALLQIMALGHFSGRLPVYIGDDRTDEDGFTEAERMGIALPVAGEIAHRGRQPSHRRRRCVVGWRSWPDCGRPRRERSRSRRRRQQPCGGADQPARPHRLVLPAAPGRRSRLLQPAEERSRGA